MALDHIGDERRTGDVVARLGVHNVETVEDGVGLVALELRVYAALEKRVARRGIQDSDALVGVARHLDVLDALAVDDLFDCRSAARRSGARSSRRETSALLRTMMVCLFTKSGLIAWKSWHCASTAVALLRQVHEVEYARL